MANEESGCVKNGKMIFSEICKAFEQDGEGIFGIEGLENI